MTLRMYHVLGGIFGAGTAAASAVHAQAFGGVSVIQTAMAFFLILNTVVCLWEIILGAYIKEIKAEYLQALDLYKGKRWQCALDFFMLPLSPPDILNPRTFTRVWSTYSLYDPSYSNQESFGFFVDVGNGWTTLLPTLLLLAGMTVHTFISARLLGAVSICIFWQEMYGTLIYFLSFVFNRRWVGKGFVEIALFVGLTNPVWIIFPALGMWCSWEMINSNTYNVFLP